MKSTTTLAFTGDIGFDHYMQNKWEDEDLIDPSLLAILTGSDHVIAKKARWPAKTRSVSKQPRCASCTRSTLGRQSC